ncbi:MAG: hypothetical protein RLY31_2090 [Bacteroidota bacterium]|jgi:glycosyltransferase involved in cell wall biosynthesis
MKKKCLLNEQGAAPAEVAVIITLYNYADLVQETLASLSSQTLPVFDLVVVDDCSTDDSAEVVRSWLATNRQRFNTVRLVQHTTNQGLGKTRNTAFYETGETPFVFVLDADNILYPNALSELLKAIRLSGADFAYSYLEHFGDSQRLGGLHPWLPEQLVYGNTIDAMVMMRKSTWEKVGGYSEDMPYNGWEDYDLWFKIAEAGGWGIRVPQILCRYRVHVGSMLNQETNRKVEELTAYLRRKHPTFSFPG